MNIKENLKKVLKEGITVKVIMEDVKEGRCSKSGAIVVLFKSGMSVKEINETFNEYGVKMRYNHVYNVVSQKFTKDMCDNIKNGNTVNYLED